MPTFTSAGGRIRKLSLYLPSHYLQREVTLTVLLPPSYRINILSRYPLVLLNDGQDFDALELHDRLQHAYDTRRVRPRVVVGIHANERRMREYGTSRVSSAEGLGDLADAHRLFVVKELIPYLHRRLRVRRNREFTAIGGFSLGGLSAFDIAYHQELHFGQVACFSASFWWRATPFNPDAPDENRIAIERVRNAVRPAELHYFFMAGTDEEESDRNNNGIIDVIDDTLDMIAALVARGVPSDDICYMPVEGGQHNQQTWGPALIDWLRMLP